MSELVRLNLGAGDTPLEGYTPIDRKSGHEVYPLDVPDASVDEIRASHILEHFPHGQVIEVVRHWVSKLRPGGLMKLAVPNFEWIAKKYLAGEPINVQGYTMGGQIDENDFHSAAFDRETLTEIMVNAGLERLGAWESEIRDAASLPVSLNLLGFKPSAAINKLGNVGIVTSKPRFGPTMHGRCMMQALRGLEAVVAEGQGAYWHQVLCENIEKQIEDGAEYILTIDYDSIFSRADIFELYRLILCYPDFDAVCAVQMRRHGEHTLFGMWDEEANKPKTKVYAAEFARNITKINSGHFGLTMFRSASLDSVPRPWMLPEPNQDGRWDEGKVDADMDFWRRWKEHGKTLGLANNVVIGHMEEIISWPGKDFKPVYQPVSDYVEDGIPAKVTRLGLSEARQPMRTGGAKCTAKKEKTNERPSSAVPETADDLRPVMA